MYVCVLKHWQEEPGPKELCFRVTYNSGFSDGYIQRWYHEAQETFCFRVLCCCACELATVNIRCLAEQGCVEHRIWIMSTSCFMAEQCHTCLSYLSPFLCLLCSYRKRGYAYKCFLFFSQLLQRFNYFATTTDGSVTIGDGISLG